MTDAAVRVLLNEDEELAKAYVPKLTARANAWTSGQWMTEKEGGSDVGRTGTVAREAGDGWWTLRGTKWFTSATTADISLALARPEIEDGPPPFAGAPTIRLGPLDEKAARALARSVAGDGAGDFEHHL